VQLVRGHGDPAAGLLPYCNIDEFLYKN
jgi:hypothetical protein